MDADWDRCAKLTFIEDLIHYVFRSRDLLELALTAAGAEENNHDGNRKLGQLGVSLLEFFSVLVGFKSNRTREGTSNLRLKVSCKEQRATIAKENKIDKCIKYDKRPGSRSDRVLGIAINAIVGAVFIDSNSINLALRVVFSLRLITTPETPTVNPIVTVLPDRSAADATTTYESGNQIQETPMMTGPFFSATDDGGLDLYALFSPPAWLDNVNLAIPAPSFSVPIGHPDTSSFDYDGIDNANGECDYEFAEPIDLSDLNLNSSAETIAEEEAAAIPEVEERQDLALEGFVEQISPSITDSLQSQVEEDLLDGRFEASDQQSSMTESSSELGMLQASNSEGPSSRKGSTRQNHKRSIDTDNSGNLRSKKSKSGPSACQLSTSLSLESYLSDQTEKCRSLGMQSPQETYFTLEIRQRAAKLDTRGSNIGIILAGIASPYSIALLQQTIRQYKHGGNLDAFKPTRSLSVAERFDIICDLDRSITWLYFLRRYHVLKLFEDSGGASTPRRTLQIVQTPQTFTKTRARRGNPANIIEAAVVDDMLEKIFPNFPNLPPEDREKKRRTVKKLKKLGERLYVLVTEFGLGILGLIPDASLTVNCNLSISDTMILEPTDGAFRQLVSLLKESQGEMLLRFSRQVSSIIDAIMDDSLQHSEPRPFEETDEKDILRLPKGSPELLKLITPGRLMLPLGS